MKKVLKSIIMSLIIIGVIASTFTTVKAHSVDLDPDSIINFPMWVINGEGQITIDDSVTDYTLYYQAVEMSDANYEQIEQINETTEAELETIKQEIEELRLLCEDLQQIYEQALADYVDANLEGITGTELEELELAKDTAEANYEAKRDEYVAKQDEYTTTYNEAIKKIKELTPSYVDENWIETEDGIFNIDLSQFSGDKAFAVWVKLVDANGLETYDQGTYTMSGNKVETVDVEGISIDKTNITLKVGSSYTLHATVTPEDATNKLVTWESDNEDVVTVSDGVVTAKAPGTANVIATTSDGNYTATCKVTVEQATINNNDNNKDDDTVSNVKLPYAGVNTFVIIGIVAMISISIISYKIYTRYKDVK